MTASSTTEGLRRDEIISRLSRVDTLTETHRREAQEVLSEHAEGDAPTLESGVNEGRCCPRCNTPGSHGKALGLRHRKKGCGRTFDALAGTSLSRLHHKKRWLSFGESMTRGDMLREAAERVAVKMAFRYRLTDLRFSRAFEGGLSVEFRRQVARDPLFGKKRQVDPATGEHPVASPLAILDAMSARPTRDRRSPALRFEAG